MRRLRAVLWYTTLGYVCYRSLVTTNDHLLKELEDTRKRHKDQMQQMNWSYNQLRRTIESDQYGQTHTS